MVSFILDNILGCWIDFATNNQATPSKQQDNWV